MTGFLTLEDINSAVTEFYNTPFWDMVRIDTGSLDNFSNLYFDYLKVTRTYSSNYTFSIQVSNDLRTGQYYFMDNNGDWISNVTESSGVITVVSTTPIIQVYCQLFVQSTSQTSFNNVEWIVEDVTPKLASKSTGIEVTVTLKEVNPNFNVNGKTFNVNGASVVCSNKQLSFRLPYNNGYSFTIGYSGVSVPVFIYSNLKNINVVDVPGDSLLVGRVNTFDLFSESDNLDVTCNYPISIEGKTVTMDLEDKTDLSYVNMTVHTNEDEDYYPNDFTFRLPCEYSYITSLTELNTLISKGGVGRLGVDLTLTNDLQLTKPIFILGNGYTIDLDGHKIIVGSECEFKAENTKFTNGFNTIQQNIGTNVELTSCSFTGCTGLGSVIDCQVDIQSLENPNDFNTTLTDCKIENSDMAILHGGELEVNNCNIDGKIGNKDYPYFLYQTDGNAVILNSQFNISSENQISHDIEFNSCIFICGETATINGLGYTDLKNNNINSFIETPQNNASNIELTYYYDLISDYITLSSSKGYCHGISNEDYIFKTNVTPTREE